MKEKPDFSGKFKLNLSPEELEEMGKLLSGFKKRDPIQHAFRFEEEPFEILQERTGRQEPRQFDFREKESELREELRYSREEVLESIIQRELLEAERVRKEAEEERKRREEEAKLPWYMRKDGELSPWDAAQMTDYDLSKNRRYAESDFRPVERSRIEESRQELDEYKEKTGIDMSKWVGKGIIRLI